MRFILARLILLLGLLAPMAHAENQMSFSAAVDSDDRFRGMSLSHGRPDVRFDFGYDGDDDSNGSGFYTGASLAAASGRMHRSPLIHYTAYAGWVSRPYAGLSWEGGVNHTHIGDRERYDYDEVYAGLITKAVSARLSWSPRYFGHDVQSLYADVSGGREISPGLRVFAHAGWLTRVSGRWALRSRYDLSAGLATAVHGYELRVSVTQSPSSYYWGREDGGTGLVVSAVRAF